MAIWKVECLSYCGTYFASYLQSVTVIANSKEEAITETKKWLKKEGRSFIRSDPETWDIECLEREVPVAGVIDYHADSDY